MHKQSAIERDSERFIVPAYFMEWAGKDCYDTLQRCADIITNPDSTPRKIASAARFVLASARFVLNCAAPPFSWEEDEDE